MPGVVAVYHAAGDDLGLAAFQGFPMLPAAFNRPVFATDTVRFVGDIVAAVVAETERPGRRRGRGGRRRLSTRCRRSSSHGRGALAADAPLLFPEHGTNVCFGTALRRRRRPARRRRRRRRGDDGEPAPGRRADGDQRLPRGAGRADGGAHRAGSRTRRRTRSSRRCAAVLGLEPEPAARRVPLGRRRLRAQGRRRTSSTSSRPRPRCSSAGRSSGSRPAPRTWCRWSTAATSP